jgi:hypothetical protein
VTAQLATIAADVAARIAEADQEAGDAAAAFAAGRFSEYWQARAAGIMQRIKEGGENAIARAGTGQASG